jgi:tetratricopeptide (TPR) repeat protein
VTGRRSSYSNVLWKLENDSVVRRLISYWTTSRLSPDYIGRPPDSRKYERAVEMRVKEGVEDKRLAATLNALAQVNEDQGKPRSAEPLYKRALAIREKTMSMFHPDVAVSLTNLGMIYKSEGRLAEAEPFLSRAFAICEGMLPHDDPRIAQAWATLPRDQHRNGEARPLLQKAISILDGGEHQDDALMAEILGTLGSVSQDQGPWPPRQTLIAAVESGGRFGSRLPAIPTRRYHFPSIQRYAREPRGVAVEGKYGEAFVGVAPAPDGIAS